MIKTFSQNRSIYLYWAIISILILLSPLFTTKLSVLALMILVLFLFKNDESESLALLFGVLPFANFFKIAPGTISFFTIAELTLICIILFKKHRLNGLFLSAVILFTIYILIFPGYNFSFISVVKIILGFFVIYCGRFLERKHFVNVVYLLSFSTILMLVFSNNQNYLHSILPYMSEVNFYIDKSGSLSDIMRNGGFFEDPNQCSMFIIMQLCILSVAYYFGDIKSEFWLIIVIIVPLGLTTYSKSYFLSIALFSIYIFIFILMRKHRVWAIVASIMGTLIVLDVFSGKYPAVNLILNRFDRGNITTGRGYLNYQYIEYISNNLNVFLFGEGICSEAFYGMSNNVHNFFIDVWYKVGFIGSALYFSVIGLGFKKVKKVYKNDFFIKILPITFLILMYSFLAGMHDYVFPFYVILCQIGYSYSVTKS